MINAKYQCNVNVTFTTVWFKPKMKTLYEKLCRHHICLYQTWLSKANYRKATYGTNDKELISTEELLQN